MLIIDSRDSLVVGPPLLEANWQLTAPDNKNATAIIRAMDRMIPIGFSPAFFDDIPSGLIRRYLKKLVPDNCEPCPERRVRRFYSSVIGSDLCKRLLAFNLWPKLRPTGVLPDSDIDGQTSRQPPPFRLPTRQAVTEF